MSFLGRTFEFVALKRAKTFPINKYIGGCPESSTRRVLWGQDKVLLDQSN